MMSTRRKRTKGGMIVKGVSGKAPSRASGRVKTAFVSGKEGKKSLILSRAALKRQKTAPPTIFSLPDYVRDVSAAIREPLLVLNQDLEVLSANRSFYETFQVKPKETEGKSFYRIGDHQWDIPELRQKLEQILHKRTSFEDFELKQKFPRIRERTILVNARSISQQAEEPKFILLSIRDITESKKVEEASERFSSFPAVNPTPIVETDIAGRVLYMNPAAKRLFPDLPKTGGRHPFLAGFSSAVNELKSGKKEWVLRQVEVEGAWYEQTIFAVEGGSRIRIYSTDITGNRQTQQALKESENKYRIVADNTYDWEFWSNPEGKYLYVSPSCKRITGHDPEEFLKDPDLRRRIIHPDDRSCFDDHLRKVEGRKAGEVEYRIIRPDGTIRWIHHACQPVFDSDRNYLGTRGSNRDVTERKHKEEELRQLNRVLKALSDSNQAMMHATSELDYLNEVCNFIIEDCGHLMVWIGFAENDENKTVRPVAQAGFEGGYLKTVNITWADTERGRGPTGTAIRTGKPYICRNMLTDPNFKPWRKEALKRGYASSIVLPLAFDGKTFGAINIYSKEPDPFSEEEIKLLTELSNDLAYGIMTIRLRLEHEQAEVALAKSEEKYRFLYEEGQSFNIIIGPDQTIKDANKTALNILGYRKDEVIGKPALEFIPDEYRERVKVILAETFSGGTGEEYEIPVLAKDGSVHTILFSAGQATLMEGGAITGIVVTGIDITERKKAEEKLEKQAVMMANVSEAIMGFGPDMKINFWSPSAEQLYGFTSSEALGRQASDLLRAVYLDITRDEAVDQLMKTGHLKVENIHHAKDGRALHVEYHATGIYNQGNELVGIVTVMHDITERKKAEEELRQTKDYLESLLNYANAPIICWDTKFKITRFNHAFEHLSDYKAEEVLGKDLSILFPKESKEESLNKIKRTLSGEYWEVVEIPILRKNGDIRIALWNSANIYAEDGKTILATIAQGQDITERKKAEEELRQTRDYLENLFNYANAPIICWDSEFKITQFNHAFEHLTDYKAEEVLGKDLSILFPPESREESLDKIRRTLGGEYWEVVEIPILQKTGDIRIALWNSANVYADDGKTLLATIAQGQDITERKKTEEEIRALNEHLRQHEAELAASNKELEAFSYSVSHDLRAPLRNIDGFSQALLEDYSSKLDDKGKDFLKRVRAATQRMGGLIDDLLQLSLTMRKEMQREGVDLSRLAHSIIDELKETEPERQVEVIIKEKAFVSGDTHLLRQCLENLLGNAWKFTSHRSPAKIEFGHTEKDGEKLFYVKDNGAGFDMKYADKLFIPFQRLHSLGEFSGNGIGLAIVKRIIERHSGSVWAEGEVEKGATFYFKL